ncbi:hypothetical protein NPIL_565101 [Nephila pilipes]|uniref:Uncharacterized protein n=1 Tax=Nephila pilipes TaxID=299642 RepID=A0A8X6TVX1_NEPPI|nr:hypothetical protein NPIL_565101 [Nephila pilipes]
MAKEIKHVYFYIFLQSYEAIFYFYVVAQRSSFPVLPMRIFVEMMDVDMRENIPKEISIELLTNNLLSDEGKALYMDAPSWPSKSYPSWKTPASRRSILPPFSSLLQGAQHKQL